MNEQERRYNHVLHALDEAHRLGRITRADYRARRRALLARLGDSDGVTARNVIVPVHGPSLYRVQSTGTPVVAEVNEASALFPERGPRRWILWLVAAGLVLIAVLLFYLLMRRSVP